MKQLKLLPLFFLGLTACTEEDNIASYPEYTHYENPQWVAVQRPDKATAPTNWTVEFGGGIDTPQWTPVSATPANAPTWENPDAYIYPSSMTAIIRMSEYIEPDMSAYDQLAAFIDGQCRGTGALRSGLWLLQIKADPAETRQVELRYYSTSKQELFVCPNAFRFEADTSQGSADAPFRPVWDSQSDLPYYMDVTVQIDLSGFDEAAVSENDLVAAFAGNECRALARPIFTDGQYKFNLRLFARQAEEEFQLRYYTAQLKDIYVLDTPVKMQHTSKQTKDILLKEHGYMDAYVSLPKTLLPYATEADAASAFINGQPCSVIQDQKPGQFTLKIKASTNDVLSFAYYCDSLKYIFRTDAFLAYADASAWGSVESPQKLPLHTAEKLVTMDAVFTVTEYEAFNTVLAEEDILAAFVGDECRAVGSGKMQDGTLIFPLQIHGTLGVNETFTLRLYTQQNKYLFNCPRTFDFQPGEKLGSIYEPTGIELIVVE